MTVPASHCAQELAGEFDVSSYRGEEPRMVG